MPVDSERQKPHQSVRVRYKCKGQSACKRSCAVTHVVYTEYICIFMYEFSILWNLVQDNEKTDRPADEHLGFLL